MGRQSKEKGARGEREAADEIFRLFGCEAHRGRQYHGGTDSPDIVTAQVGIHYEVKRTEKLQLYPAMEQAERDAGDAIPVVLHKRNRKPWLAIVKLENLPLLASLLAASPATPAPTTPTTTPSSIDTDARLALDGNTTDEGNPS